MAVNVFTPPESWLIEIGFFPFGLANISILDSKGLLWSDNIKSQSSSSINSERKTSLKYYIVS